MITPVKEIKIAAGTWQNKAQHSIKQLQTNAKLQRVNKIACKYSIVLIVLTCFIRQ